MTEQEIEKMAEEYSNGLYCTMSEYIFSKQGFIAGANAMQPEMERLRALIEKAWIYAHIMGRNNSNSTIGFEVFKKENNL